jgi:hypothetical protein
VLFRILTSVLVICDVRGVLIFPPVTYLRISALHQIMLIGTIGFIMNQ